MNFYDMFLESNSRIFNDIPSDITIEINKIKKLESDDLDKIWNITKIMCKNYIKTDYIEKLGIDVNELLEDIKFHSILNIYIVIKNKDKKDKSLKKLLEEYYDKNFEMEDDYETFVNKFYDKIEKCKDNFCCDKSNIYKSDFYSFFYKIIENERKASYNFMDFNILYYIIINNNKCPYNNEYLGGTTFKNIDRFYRSINNNLRNNFDSNGKLDHIIQDYTIERLFNISFLYSLSGYVNERLNRNIKLIKYINYFKYVLEVKKIIHKKMIYKKIKYIKDTNIKINDLESIIKDIKDRKIIFNRIELIRDTYDIKKILAEILGEDNISIIKNFIDSIKLRDIVDDLSLKSIKDTMSYEEKNNLEDMANANIQSMKEILELIDIKIEDIEENHIKIDDTIILNLIAINRIDQGLNKLKYMTKVNYNSTYIRSTEAKRLSFLAEIVSIPLVFCRSKYIQSIDEYYKKKYDFTLAHSILTRNLLYLNSVLIPLLSRVYYISLCICKNNNENCIRNLLGKYINKNESKYMLNKESHYINDGTREYNNAFEINATQIIYNYRNIRKSVDKNANLKCILDMVDEFGKKVINNDFWKSDSKEDCYASSNSKFPFNEKYYDYKY